jgi:hypothetical protein
MPLPINNSRPAIPYVPEQVLPNHNRYEMLGKIPPTAKQLDGDFNRIVDLVNTLAKAINEASAGIFPGADNPLNADRFPTTDGQGNISWTPITPFNLTDNAVHTRHILDAAITPDKIQPQAVGTDQIVERAVTPSKVNSANAAPGEVMAADGAGSAVFQPNRGRILQVVSHENTEALRDQNDPTASAQNPKSFRPTPFRVRITPLKTHSKLIIFYSINVGAGANQCAAVTLCKNDVPFKVGRSDPQGADPRQGADLRQHGYLGVTHNLFSAMGQMFSDGQYGCHNFSSLFVDTGIQGTQITYEIKKAHPSTCLNTGSLTSDSGGGRNTISVMHVLEVDI